jgi:hypothetical protein
LHPFNEGERGNDGNPVRFRLGPQSVIRIATNKWVIERLKEALDKPVLDADQFNDGG